MTRLAQAGAILVVALFAIFVIGTSAGDSVAQGNLPGRSAVTPTVSSERFIVRFIVEWSDGGRDVYQLQSIPMATATPDETDTPTASATATQTRTSTPSLTPTSSATATATASNTPTATLTPTDTPTPQETAIFASPTPERTQPPTNTPGPTPPPKTCELKAKWGINQRAAPDPQAVASGATIPGNSSIAFTEFASDARGLYLWGHHATGWSVVYELGTREWWWYGVSGATEFCRDLPGWPNIWPNELWPPEPEVRNPVGLHMVFGTGETVLTDFVFPLGDAGLCPSSMKAMDFTEWTIPFIRWKCPDTTIIYRTSICGDFPNLTGVPAVVARNWYPCLKDVWSRVDADLYEPINEMPGDVLFRARLALELLELANADGYCILVPGDGVGNPSVDEYRTYYPTLYRYLRDHPCNGISQHAYGIDTLLSESGQWLGYGHRLDYGAMMGQVAGANTVPVWLTEIGSFAMFVTDPISCDVLVDDITRYALSIRTDEYIRGANLFTAGGGGGQWWDVQPCLPQLTRALIAALG